MLTQHAVQVPPGQAAAAKLGVKHLAVGHQQSRRVVDQPGEQRPEPQPGDEPVGEEDRYQGHRARQVAGVMRIGHPTNDGSGRDGGDEVEGRHLGQGATFTDAEADHGGGVEQQGLEHDPPQVVRGSEHHRHGPARYPIRLHDKRHTAAA